MLFKNFRNQIKTNFILRRASFLPICCLLKVNAIRRQGCALSKSEESLFEKCSSNINGLYSEFASVFHASRSATVHLLHKV